MQNSAVESHVPEKVNRESKHIINLADGIDRPSIVLQRTSVKCVANDMKEAQLLATKNNKNQDTDNCSIRSESSTLKSCLTSGDPKEVTPKQKNKFTRPRLNQLTTQRISRLRGLQVAKANAVQTRVPGKKKEASNCSETSIKVETALAENKIDPLQSQLEEMQSNFMRRVAGVLELGHVYKLVTVVHANNCKVLEPNDDLVTLPDSLSQSMNGLKALCHDVILDGFRFISEQFESLSTGVNDEALSAVSRDELCKKLYGVLSDKLLAVDKQLMQVCQSIRTEETAELQRQICVLTEANTMLKLDRDFDDMRTSRDELQQLLDHLQEQNNNLILELAEKKEQIKGQTDLIDILRIEAMELKDTAKVVQEQMRESKSRLEHSRKTITKQKECIDKLEALLGQRDKDLSILKQKTEQLTLTLGEKERQLSEQTTQLLELEEIKAFPSVAANSEVDTDAIKSEMERQQEELQKVKHAEQMLLGKLEEKQEALRKAELKIAYLEEQVEHHRQVLAVRGERINYLDQEMKQRELDYNRKLNEVVAQTSQKETLITQITNELASTNEQFQNLCSTISLKQSKLHSQEHVIKLLEESNARSVMLHTKLGEKNAMLRDELEYLRRTVNNLMLGYVGSDTGIADNILE